jgi:hypothetical protein
MVAVYILVGSGIAPHEHALHLFIGPGIQVDRLYFANVRAHATVDARAAVGLW